jgi:hypothetical protein
MPSDADELAGNGINRGAADKEPEQAWAWREVNVASEDDGRWSRAQGWRPVRIAIILGAVAIAVLPVAGVIWKAIMCGYGLDSDFSGVTFFMPMVIGVGAAVGGLAGLAGKGVGMLLKDLVNSNKGLRAGAVVGYVLAVGAAGYLSIYPFAFFMFPDC